MQVLLLNDLVQTSFVPLRHITAMQTPANHMEIHLLGEPNSSFIGYQVIEMLASCY
jgi:hypothetical protein